MILNFNKKEIIYLIDIIKVGGDKYIKKIIYIKTLYTALKSKKNINNDVDKYIKIELEKSKELLDSVNGYSLDYDQRLAILNNYRNVLVLAGAGSGKTLTIIGKIRYLLEIKKVDIKEILCLSFTNETVNQLKQTLYKKYNYNLKVVTFHKLAYEIISKSGKAKKITSINKLEKLVDNYFKTGILTLPTHLSEVIHYFTYKKIIKKVSPLNYPQVYNNLLKTKEMDILSKTIIKFIHSIKSTNNFDFTYYLKKNVIFSKKIKIRNSYLKIVYNIYNLYQNELDRNNEIDFDDMINLSINLVDNSLGYKYIIVDEFQDTSYTKYLLLKNICEKNNSNLMAVGDDFQSIYRFTGCDLNIFLNFNKLFSDSRIYLITRTYRNSNELINVAGKFVMKNRYQMKKNLISSKSNLKPIKIYYYKSNITNPIIKALEEMDNNMNVLILGRNNCDINSLSEISDLSIEGNNITYINKPNLNIKYLTVHASKGLEADAVIIINLENKYTGFPSKIVDHDIFNILSKHKDLYPYDEERRLFYVALTRTKNNVYLITKKNNESVFITEIIKNSRKNIEIKNF